MGLYCLQDRLPVTLEAMRQGLREAFLPGRFQHFSKPCQIILDVAHNPAAAQLLANDCVLRDGRQNLSCGKYFGG